MRRETRGPVLEGLTERARMADDTLRLGMASRQMGHMSIGIKMTR